MSILVSICCITYNHENYIADAIKGFLIQKTSFPIEIIIHDDASTDKTKEIIRSYEAQYPNLIKPIYQSENQYSKGIKISATYVWPKAKGKYIALCEGDDYWTDPYKLQKQVDFMESHPDCSMCFHNAEVVKPNKKQTGKYFIPLNCSNFKFNAGDIALLNPVPTASAIYLKSILVSDLPKWYYEAVVGDYPLEMIAASFGYAYYLCDIMSAYRKGVKGSHTSQLNRSSLEKRIDYFEKVIEILCKFNEFSYYNYSCEVDKAKISREIEILILKKKIKELKQPRYKDFYDTLTLRSKLKLYARCYFPNLYAKLSFIKLTIKDAMFTI